MLLHNMITKTAVTVTVPFNHEVIADLSSAGIDTGMVSFQFLATPWQVKGKPSETPAYYHPFDFKTQVYRMIDSHFYPVPYVGMKNKKPVLLIACDDDDTSPDAVELVFEEVKRSLMYYFFFEGIKKGLIESLKL